MPLPVIPPIPTYLAVLLGAAGGNALSWGKESISSGLRLLRRRFSSTLTVDEQQGETFFWLLSWCNKYLPETPHVTAVRHYEDSHLAPAPGTYYLRYRGRRVVLSRQTYSASAGGGSNTQPMIRLELTIVGRDRKFWVALLEEGQELFRPKDNSILVHTQAGLNWGYSERQQPRSLDTVVLEPRIKQDLLHDIGEFLDSETWYAERGISWRRGYLFYGAPGNGKSSLIKALAGYWSLPLYVLSLGDPELTDAALSTMINALRNCLIVLEDVDTVLPGREVAGDTQRGLTYSGILNAIDGVSSGHGTILIMTANHPEYLDPALVRPGRVDVRVLIDNPSGVLVGELFSRFYPVQQYPQAQSLAISLPATYAEQRLSMATIQGALMRHRHDPQAGYDALREAYACPPPVSIPPPRQVLPPAESSPHPTRSPGVLNQVAPTGRLIRPPR